MYPFVCAWLAQAESTLNIDSDTGENFDFLLIRSALANQLYTP